MDGETFVALLLVVWICLATLGAVDNVAFQTPDARIIKQCKTQGYITVKQTVISCSIEKEIK